MTFNLRYGTAHDGSNSWQYRRAHAADIINRYGPVVVGSQEGMAEQLTELQELLARLYERFGEPREEGKEHVQILYDTSAVERLDGGTFWLSETPDVPGGKVGTLDVEGSIARYEGAKVVWVEVNKVLKRDGLSNRTPMLLTGDFNTFRSSDVLQYLTRDRHGPQFQDSWSSAGYQIGSISRSYHEFRGPAYDTTRWRTMTGTIQIWIR